MKNKIFILALIYLLPMGLPFPGEKRDPINFWQKLFTEPVETIYFIMKDGAPFRYSNQDENFIYMRAEDLEKALKTPEKTYRIKDIAVVIHNHFINDEFSDGDRKQYRDLKKRGFDDLFLMYCHRTNKTYSL